METCFEIPEHPALYSLCTLILLIAPPASEAGANGLCTTACYVDAATGDDSNSGESGDPFATIQMGVDTVQSGGTVLVAAGTYNEQVEVSANGVTVQGAGPTQTLLVSNETCTNTMGSGATAGVRLLGDHTGITLRDFGVSGYDIGLDIGENIGRTISDVTIVNVSASDNCVHGILSQAGDSTGIRIDASTLDDNGFGFFAGRGLWLVNGSKSGISVTRSEVNRNRLGGVDIGDGDVSGLTVVGNTVIGNGDFGISVIGPQGPGTNRIDDNTVTDNGRFGIDVKNPGGSTAIRNNVVSRTGPGSETRDYAGIAVYRRSPGATNADQPSGVVVEGNTVTGFIEPSGDGEGFGIVVEGQDMSVTGNDVSGNDVGIQVQEGNPFPNTNGTDYFDRGDASVAATAAVNRNNITGNAVGMRALGTTNTIDGTENWWNDVSGPAGEGPGTGDSVSPGIDFCPWLDAPAPFGSAIGTSGRVVVCGLPRAVPLVSAGGVLGAILLLLTVAVWSFRRPRDTVHPM